LRDSEYRREWYPHDIRLLLPAKLAVERGRFTVEYAGRPPDTESGCSIPAMPEQERSSPGTLVLLHGLGRTARSMRRLAAEGTRRGYRVHNIGYPSRRAGVFAHAERVGLTLAALPDTGPLHAVTHSMGGIVLRAALAGGWLAPERMGRVVMLAPPNGGTELADWLCRTPLFVHVVGPAVPELRTGASGIAGTLPPVPFELGVIAGAMRRSSLAASLFDGPNDGKVSVARARVRGMRDLLVVPHGHTFIMNAPDVIAQTFHFLSTGRFRGTFDAPATSNGAG
jgi:pimeloyl-ACP methyl ester carboxylesterase